MFRIKRPAIIGLLMVLLVFTGYLNYRLTQESLLNASKEYQKYEYGELANMDLDDDLLADEDDGSSPVDIVKELDEDEEDVAQVINNANESFEEKLSQTTSTTSKNYFVEHRLSRDKLRAALVDRLDKIVNNEKTDNNMRTEAQKEIIKIGNISEKELQLEGLIKGKGFEDVLVFLTEEDIKVVVSNLELSEQDMVKILDIVKSETQLDMSSIKIMKKP